MNNVLNAKIEKVIKKVLLPMMSILNNKNIYTGINYTYNANQLFIGFDRRCLSNTNQLIIEKISFVYS